MHRRSGSRGAASALGAFGSPDGVSPGLAYVPLAADVDELCVTSFGSDHVTLTVLGYLSTEGPDPMRLPPTIGLVEAEIPAPGLQAFTPTRVLDTRVPIGVPTAAPLGAGKTLELDLYDVTSWDSTAAVLNLAITEPASDGFVTVYPCDEERPLAANVTFAKGETVPNQVVAKLSADDTVCLFSSATTHLVADLDGTFEGEGGGAGIHPITPTRVLDTRTPIGVTSAGKLPVGQVLTLQVGGVAGAPTSGVHAVTMNVTVTEPDAAGFISAYPCDQPRPTAANLNFTAGQTVPNLVTVAVSQQGNVCLFTSGTTHLVADLAAWYADDEIEGYRELTPVRLLDTREGTGAPSRAPVATDTALTLQVTGRGGVPVTSATAVTLNVSVTAPIAPGFITAYPCDQPRPTAANLNFVAGETVSNLVTVKLSATGKVCLYTIASAHLIADVAGYFTDQTELGLVLALIEE